MFSKTELKQIYQRRAPAYDRWVSALRMAGFQIPRYRAETVESLKLRPGDTVVDIGCGTGLNLRFLEAVVGPEGQIIGVDLTGAMLAQAGERATAAGWRNVELVEADASTFEFPKNLGGVLSTFALTLITEYDDVIRRAAEALRPKGRVAVFDLKEPEGWPAWSVRFAAWLNRPFGVTLDLADRHPWESIQHHLHMVEFKEAYGGMLYRAVGERSEKDVDIRY